MSVRRAKLSLAVEAVEHRIPRPSEPARSGRHRSRRNASPEASETKGISTAPSIATGPRDLFRLRTTHDSRREKRDGRNQPSGPDHVARHAWTFGSQTMSGFSRQEKRVRWS